MLVLQYPLAWCSSGCLGGVVVECVTSGETRLLVTLGELDVEVGDQRVDVVVPLDLQAEGRGEGQVLGLHRVDVHLLHTNRSNVSRTLHTSGDPAPSNTTELIPVHVPVHGVKRH